MKSTIEYIILLLLTSISMNAQKLDTEQDLKNLKGKKVEILKIKGRSYSVSFYKKCDKNKILEFPKVRLRTSDVLDSLEDKYFTFVGYDKHQDKYDLIFHNSITDTFCFMDYDLSYELPFLLKYYDPNPPIQNICDDIEERYDKFTFTKTFNTPYRDWEDYSSRSYPIVFHKLITKGVPTYYLSLYAPGLSLTYGNGAVIILKSGKRINKPYAKIDVDVDFSDYLPYSYSVWIQLTAAEIEIFKNNSITDFTLYIHDVTDIDGVPYMKYFRCLSSKK